MPHTLNRIAVLIAAVITLVGCGQQNDSAQQSSPSVAKETDSILDALKKAAETGDAKSQWDLARRYTQGNGVDRNFKSALEWATKAAEGGNVDAMTALAWSYKTGDEVVSRDEEKSKSWMKKAADAGDAEAQYQYSQNFGSADRNAVIKGSKDEKEDNTRRYVEWLEKAAAQKHRVAQYELGMTYLLGAFEFPWDRSGKKLFDPDSEKALPLLRTSADAGYWQSQWAIAILFQAGFGKVKADKEQSEKYWELLAGQSNPDTLNRIGVLYDETLKQFYKDGRNKYKGKNLDFNETNKVALEYFQRAADKDDKYGLYNLGRSYKDGRGVLKDESKALEYFKRAAEKGHYDSMRKVAFAYLEGQGVVKDYAEAHQWLIKAAAENETSKWSDVHKIRNALGALHEYGWGIEKDLVRAYAWYNIAASGGYDKAKQNLARVEKAINPDELREAQTLSREWKPGQPMVRSGSQPTSSTGSDRKSGATNTSGKSFKLATVGTGFFVSSTGNVITNNHVVDGCGEIRIPADNMTAKLVVADQANDLALIKLEVVGKPVLALPSGDDLKQGEDVFAFGFPLDGYLPSAGNITTGIISALAGPGNNSSLIQTTAPVQPGNSGGPLLNKKGKVVGVVVGKANAIKIAKVTGDIPQNINFAIAPRTVKSFLDGNRVEYQKKGDTFSFDKDSVAIADEARKASVKIECWR